MGGFRGRPAGEGFREEFAASPIFALCSRSRGDLTSTLWEAFCSKCCKSVPAFGWRTGFGVMWPSGIERLFLHSKSCWKLTFSSVLVRFATNISKLGMVSGRHLFLAQKLASAPCDSFVTPRVRRSETLEGQACMFVKNCEFARLQARSRKNSEFWLRFSGSLRYLSTNYPANLTHQSLR